MKSRKVSYSCGCTTEDCKYEVFYAAIIAPLAHGFVYANLLRFVRLSKSTKRAESGGDVCCYYLANQLCGNYKDIGQ